MSKYFFVGINIGGEGTERTSATIFEYRPTGKKGSAGKLILKELHEKLGARKFEDSDLSLYRAINKHKRISIVAINAPLRAMRCIHQNLCEHEPSKY